MQLKLHMQIGFELFLPIPQKSCLQNQSALAYTWFVWNGFRSHRPIVQSSA